MCNLTVSEAELDGRAVWRLSATPPPEAKAANAAERTTLKTKAAYWIDKGDFAVIRRMQEFLAPVAGMQAGTTIGAEYGKVNDECWLPAHSSWIGRFKPVAFVDVNLTTETQFKDYQVRWRIVC